MENSELERRAEAICRHVAEAPSAGALVSTNGRVISAMLRGAVVLVDREPPRARDVNGQRRLILMGVMK